MEGQKNNTNKTSELHHHVYSWVVALVIVIFILVFLLALRMTVFKDSLNLYNPAVTILPRK